jgi:hypothetical protein
LERKLSLYSFLGLALMYVLAASAVAEHFGRDRNEY